VSQAPQPVEESRGVLMSVVKTSNLFYDLLLYLQDILENSLHYCFICCSRHRDSGTKIRPCDKEICVFRFEEISGFTVYPEIAANPDIIRLDLTFAAFAAHSMRASTVFEPFPSIFLKQKQLRGKAGFLSMRNYRPKMMDSNKDIEKLKRAMQGIPSPQAIKDHCSNEASLVSYIAEAGGSSKHSYKLLKYIIATNRLQLVKLKNHQRFASVNPDIQQFIITNHSARTEAVFAERKASRGSVFAFHGSAPENWYSILRNGLRNLSDTHMMTAGAASGKGVYAAKNLMTSLGYCAPREILSNCWPHQALTGLDYVCMAIVEIINGNDRGFFVVFDDREIILRYLLLIPPGSANDEVAENLGLEEHYKKFIRLRSNRMSS
jgi:ubiquitin-conjugating enzyme E2 Q